MAGSGMNLPTFPRTQTNALIAEFGHVMVEHVEQGRFTLTPEAGAEIVAKRHGLTADTVLAVCRATSARAAEAALQCGPAHA